jgi:hypothetical protein
MAKRLPLLTVLLVGVALAFAGLIVRELTSTPRAPAPRPQPAASVAAGAPAAASAASAPGAGANYSVVASRNLFSPTRSEAPVAPPAPPPPAPVLPKPNLFGVVLIEGTPVAYLEDPVSKRVARYRVGDSVAGGTVKAIESDTVMLLRPEGQVTVRLHDPTRPRSAAPTAPGMPVTPGGPSPLGGIPPQPGQVMPPSAVRRPPIPSVLGRFPPQPTDANQPQ